MRDSGYSVTVLVEAATHQSAHVSFFRRRLQRIAGTSALTDWAVEELNRRGHLGASAAYVPEQPITSAVSLEELLVLLAMPHAEVDGRHFKLIVRAVQRGPVDVRRLARLAKQEHADTLLAWLLRHLPESEHTESTRSLAAELRPRMPGEPSYRYDFDRLLRRPATREHLWRRTHG